MKRALVFAEKYIGGRRYPLQVGVVGLLISFFHILYFFYLSSPVLSFKRWMSGRRICIFIYNFMWQKYDLHNIHPQSVCFFRPHSDTHVVSHRHMCYCDGLTRLSFYRMWLVGGAGHEYVLILWDKKTINNFLLAVTWKAYRYTRGPFKQCSHERV